MSADTCHHATGVAGRGLFAGRVVGNRPLCREHFLLRVTIEGAFPATRPGQFIQIGCRPPEDQAALASEEYEWIPGRALRAQQMEFREPLAMLRRPFSLAGRGTAADGRTWIEIVYRVVGVGTRWLSTLRAGEAVDLIGPLGNCFELPGGKSLGLLVGGGVGLPPMFYLAEAMAAAKWDGVAFVGAQSRDLLSMTCMAGVAADGKGEPGLSVEEFARHGYPAVVTTDDGSAGLRGLITQGLERYVGKLGEKDRQRAVIYTCGPHRMMQAVAGIAKKAGIDCQACLEQAMACGMGTCQSCVVKIEDAKKPQGMTDDGRPWRYKLACTDGPVFAAERVIW